MAFVRKATLAFSGVLFPSEAQTLFVRAATAPVAAIWPRLSEDERELLRHILARQLELFGVEVEGMAQFGPVPRQKQLDG